MIKRDLKIEDGATGEIVSIVVAPTPLAVLAKYAEMMSAQMAAMREKRPIDEAKMLEAVTECIYAGARRAKQGVTLGWLTDNIDAHNKAAVVAVFLEVNGFVALKAAAEQGQPSGEATAAGAS